MYRAFAMQRVPAGGIGTAKILDIQADAHQGFIYR
jgi:hypothetical protein